MIKRRLSVRIAMAAALIALSGALAVSFLTYLTAQSSELKQSRRVLRQLGLMVQRNASIAAYLDNEEIANDTILGLANNEIIAAVELTSLTGLSATYGQPKERPDEGAVRLPLESPFAEGERVGQLAIFPRQDLIARNARDTAQSQAALLGGYTLTVAILVMVITQWQLVPPLRQVAAALHRITPGSRERLVPPASHDEDEIGHLVLDINQLLNLAQDKFDNERALREEIQSLEQRFRMIFERASVGIILTDGEGRLIMSNRAFQAMLGWQHAENRAGQETCIPRLFDDAATARELLEEAISEGDSTGADLTLQGGDQDQPRWVHCLFTRIGSPAHPDGGQILVQGVITDITERKRAEAIMRQQAERDPLTNLLNRRSMEQGLKAILERAEQACSCVAVGLIDLDDFKLVNDTHGHDAGDQVLVTSAERIRGALRRGDLIARLGGDEFLIAMSDPSCKSTIHTIASKLLERLTEDIELEQGVLVRVGASIGIALSSDHGTEPDHLLAIADEAMYQAKWKGKNAYRVL